MGLAMDGSYTYNLDTSVVPGGFNADGTLNTDPPAQIHNYQLTSSQEATCTEEGKNDLHLHRLRRLLHRNHTRARS